MEYSVGSLDRIYRIVKWVRKYSDRMLDRINKIYWIKKIIPLLRVIMLVFLDPNPVNPVNPVKIHEKNPIM